MADATSVLEVRPVSLREVRRFVGENHRHNLPPRGWLFGVALYQGDECVGVGAGGRPVARGLQDGRTLEITRTCTNGADNANSMLYGALRRAGKALGYRRVVTYTQEGESGASLRAAGFRVDADVPAQTWDRPGRARVTTDLFGNDRHAMGAKTRWVWP